MVTFQEHTEIVVRSNKLLEFQPGAGSKKHRALDEHKQNKVHMFLNKELSLL